MLYGGLAQEPEVGPETRRPLLAIDLRRVTDSPAKAVRWKFVDRDFAGTFGSPAVADNVLYTVGAAGVLFALDLDTGRELWRSYLDEVGAAVLLSSPCVHAGKVLVGTQDGGVFVFQADRRKKCLGIYRLEEPVQGAPAVEGNVVYVSTRHALWALRLVDK
jgi:outer membrane protein assembly factor BamB